VAGLWHSNSFAGRHESRCEETPDEVDFEGAKRCQVVRVRVYVEALGLTGGWLVFASGCFPLFLSVSGLLYRRRRLRSPHDEG